MLLALVVPRMLEFLKTIEHTIDFASERRYLLANGNRINRIELRGDGRSLSVRCTENGTGSGRGGDRYISGRVHLYEG